MSIIPSKLEYLLQIRTIFLTFSRIFLGRSQLINKDHHFSRNKLINKNGSYQQFWCYSKKVFGVLDFDRYLCIVNKKQKEYGTCNRYR